MRFGWLAAAAAMVCALPASAETITQGFVSTFTNNGSTGPVSIGGLDLGTNRVIRSATIFYDAVTSLSAYYTSSAGGPDGIITYTGSVGFSVFNVPTLISAANTFSGTQFCSAGACSLDFRLAGTVGVPDADLAMFAGTSFIFIAPTGAVNYNISYAGAPASLMQQFRATGVQGRIVYDVAAVPEPASWALMILGVGAIGATARRRKRVAARA